MFRKTHRFSGLSEFREVKPQLARASPHPVFVDTETTFDDQPDEPSSPVNVGKQAIWNGRDDNLAYIGSGDYEITQHSEILDYIDQAVGETVGEIDIGRIRDYGARIDGMLTLNGHNVNVSDLVGEGYVPPESNVLNDRTQSVKDAKQSEGTVRDILGVGVRFNNSFDASERIRVETMGYRYICQNWLVWGEETIGEFTQLHIDELNPQDIEELIFDVIDKQEDVQSMIKGSIEDDEIPLSWVDGALEDVGFGPNYRKRILKKLRSYSTVTDSCSRWELYNAATAHLDHDVVQDVNANVYDRHQNKAVKLFTEEISAPSEERPVEEVLGEA